ncbi:hypothetical protein GCM10007079_14550 [Nocardiopsis terrae]|uniref:Tryptophan-associated transmembrane protein (Trp_oprn_chp) n=1 Tax=Nocardiopsis terrae TaxID=372655 RepID=A0ABR9HBE4_9ACTN|nr:DUF6069 family protein [Nocardiopsis terrae]MBE1456342.1 hypothetical protein [Nocardiopsis terrae]GHC77396.1 hypothetical protein GCM10007079_14550 [Nocardiopsis terrae]
MNENGSERAVNVTRLWSGGLATAVVAALVIFAGTLVVRGIFGIPVLAPEDAGYLGDAGTVGYALLAGVVALLATALLHLLLLSAPRAISFFGWIVGLATAIAAVTPFTQGAEISSQIATGLINLVCGVAIASLLRGVGRTAIISRVPASSGRRPGPALRHEGVLPDVNQREYDPERYRALEEDAEYDAARYRAERQRAEEERARHGIRDD